MWWRRISSRSTSFHASSASVRTGSYNRRRELLWDRQSISTFVYVTTPGMYLPPWESPPLRWELGDVLVNTDGRIFHVPIAAFKVLYNEPIGNEAACQKHAAETRAQIEEAKKKFIAVPKRKARLHLEDFFTIMVSPRASNKQTWRDSALCYFKQVLETERHPIHRDVTWDSWRAMLNPTVHIATPHLLIWLDVVGGTWHLLDDFLGSLRHFLQHFRMQRLVFAKYLRSLLSVTKFFSHLCKLCIYFSLTVEIVSQLWHRKITNCSE